MSDDPLQDAWERGAQGRVRVLAARKQRRQRVAIVLATVAAVAIAGAAARVVLERDEPEVPARVDLPAIRLEPVSPLVVEPTCRTPLTSGEPLRIWIGGDSLAGSLGPALGQLTADTGIAQPTYDYRTSSGLVSPSFFDWPERATEEMARVNPEVVVFIIGANDTSIVRPTPLGFDGRPAWRASYAHLVNDMLDVLAGDDRAVYWVGSPTLRDEEKNDEVRQLNDVAHDVIAQRDRATYVDAFDLFADSRGDYTATLPGSDGGDVRVRTSDGIHFTPAGADLLAAYTFAYVDKRCHLRQQAIDGQDQPVRQSPGGGEVSTPVAPPSTTSSSTVPVSSTSSTSTSTSTLPPVTAPVLPPLP